MKNYVIKAHVRTTITVAVLLLVCYLCYWALDHLSYFTWKIIGVVSLAYIIYYAYKETYKEALEYYKRKEEYKNIKN